MPPSCILITCISVTRLQYAKGHTVDFIMRVKQFKAELRMGLHCELWLGKGFHTVNYDLRRGTQSKLWLEIIFLLWTQTWKKFHIQNSNMSEVSHSKLWRGIYIPFWFEEGLTMWCLAKKELHCLGAFSWENFYTLYSYLRRVSDSKLWLENGLTL